MVFEDERDAFIEEIAGELRRPVRLDPHFDERVMAALQAPTVIPIRPSPIGSWTQRRWTISVTPVGGLAAAAAIGAIVLGGLRALGGGAPVAPVVSQPVQGATPLKQVAFPPRAADPNEMIERQLTVLIPTAKRVAVIGDFNDWNAEAGDMRRLSEDGLWSVTLPIRVGRHEYQFLVDDTLHIPDPRAPRTSSDFGSVNSVITVAPRAR